MIQNMPLLACNFNVPLPIIWALHVKDRFRHDLCSSVSYLPLLLYFHLDCSQICLLRHFVLSQLLIPVNHHTAAAQIRWCQLLLVSYLFLFLSELSSHFLVQCEVISKRVLELNKLLEGRFLGIEGIDIGVCFLKCCESILLLVGIWRHGLQGVRSDSVKPFSHYVVSAFWISFHDKFVVAEMALHAELVNGGR